MESVKQSSPPKSTICNLDTERFAELNQVKSQTIRKRYCETGSYFGVKPKKLMNGRLAWPDVQVEA
jgi:hypothetical protein